MKKHCLILCWMVVCLWTGVRAQFEGDINVKVTTNDGGKRQETSISMVVKNELVSSQITTGEDTKPPVRLVFRGDRNVLWIVNEEHKFVLEQPLKDLPRQDTTGGRERKSDIDVKQTGRTQTILGYTCEEWSVCGEEGETRIWCTSKLGNVYRGLSQLFGELDKMQRTSLWQKEFVEKGLFPLKAVSTKRGQTTTQEVTKIEEREIPSSTFEIPEDYQLQSLKLDPDKVMKLMREKMLERKQQRDDEKKKDNSDSNNKDNHR